MKKITIAIDGFSSSGKSTMAKMLAKQIGYIYVDSGAMYRAVTLYALENGLFNGESLDIASLKEHLKNIDITFQLNPETNLPETYLNGKNVENKIRTMEVSSKVSIVSTVGFVREAMVTLQQKMGKLKGIVMDGRDIGTTVFPDAELKIFVAASPDIRAKRRYIELKAKGEEVNYDEILKNVKNRDEIDQNRDISPLKQAEDAIPLDNSEMSVEEQQDWLLAHFNEAMEKWESND